MDTVHTLRRDIDALYRRVSALEHTAGVPRDELQAIREELDALSARLNAMQPTPVPRPKPKPVQKTRQVTEAAVGKYGTGILATVLIIIAVVMGIRIVWDSVPYIIRFIAIYMTGLLCEVVGYKRRANKFWVNLLAIGASVTLTVTILAALIWHLYSPYVALALAAGWVIVNFLVARAVDTKLFYAVIYVGAMVTYCTALSYNVYGAILVLGVTLIPGFLLLFNDKYGTLLNYSFCILTTLAALTIADKGTITYVQYGVLVLAMWLSSRRNSILAITTQVMLFAYEAYMWEMTAVSPVIILLFTYLWLRDNEIAWASVAGLTALCMPLCTSEFSVPVAVAVFTLAIATYAKQLTVLTKANYVALIAATIAICETQSTVAACVLLVTWGFLYMSSGPIMKLCVVAGASTLMGFVLIKEFELMAPTITAMLVANRLYAHKEYTEDTTGIVLNYVAYMLLNLLVFLSSIFLTDPGTKALFSIALGILIFGYIQESVSTKGWLAVVAGFFWTALNVQYLVGSAKLAYSVCCIAIFTVLIALGFKTDNKPLRLTSLILTVVYTLKITLFDIQGLMDTVPHILLLIASGFLCLGISLVYNKYEKQTIH